MLDDFHGVGGTYEVDSKGVRHLVPGSRTEDGPAPEQPAPAPEPEVTEDAPAE